MDVSTKMDLIGVSIGPAFDRRARSHVSSIGLQTRAAHSWAIQELATRTPLSMVHVFMVPQVQCEPVRTRPEDQNVDALGLFPEYLASATDGGPARLMTFSQDLSPVIPDLVVSQIRETFAKGSSAALLTTLAFGLKAVVSLSPVHSANRNADGLDVLQPDFSKRGMKGGLQIKVTAESGAPKYESPSPGFAGFMAETLNGQRPHRSGSLYTMPRSFRRLPPPLVSCSDEAPVLEGRLESRRGVDRAHAQRVRAVVAAPVPQPLRPYTTAPATTATSSSADGYSRDRVRRRRRQEF